MSLSDEERSTIVALEIEKAKRTFAEAEMLKQGEFWNGVASRLYYAVFHAVNALLIHDRHQVNTHNGANAMFSLHYVKTGILDAEYGRLYNQLQTMRKESDYNCAYDVDPEELKERMEPARRLIESIEKLLGQ